MKARVGILQLAEKKHGCLNHGSVPSCPQWHEHHLNEQSWWIARNLQIKRIGNIISYWGSFLRKNLKLHRIWLPMHSLKSPLCINTNKYVALMKTLKIFLILQIKCCVELLPVFCHTYVTYIFILLYIQTNFTIIYSWDTKMLWKIICFSQRCLSILHNLSILRICLRWD